MGVEIKVEHLTKRFGRQTIWEDVTLTLPAGEISVLLGPSGTGKSVFLKTLIGLLKPENGAIHIDGRDITKIRERELYEVRKLFGVLFQDGALFGSQNLFDNIAFPLREHTRKSEREIKDIVLEKMDLTGLTGAESKLPGEISGGMRKRAGLARALVLDPEILLFDEPDSGLDPVRTAYLNQLIVDLNDQIGATFLIVTHDINTARTVPDNIGLLYRRHLAMFGPREMLLSSNEPVVRQFLNAQREGPIGMAEEKDAGELAAEAGTELQQLPPIPVQLFTSDGKQRATQRPPGAWLRENGITPPPGSFPGLDVDVPEGGPIGMAPEDDDAKAEFEQQNGLDGDDRGDRDGDSRPRGAHDDRDGHDGYERDGYDPRDEDRYALGALGADGRHGWERDRAGRTADRDGRDGYAPAAARGRDGYTQDGHGGYDDRQDGYPQDGYTQEGYDGHRQDGDRADRADGVDGARADGYAPRERAARRGLRPGADDAGQVVRVGPRSSRLPRPGEQVRRVPRRLADDDAAPRDGEAVAAPRSRVSRATARAGRQDEV